MNSRTVSADTHICVVCIKNHTGQNELYGVTCFDYNVYGECIYPKTNLNYT